MRHVSRKTCLINVLTVARGHPRKEIKTLALNPRSKPIRHLWGMAEARTVTRPHTDAGDSRQPASDAPLPIGAGRVPDRRQLARRDPAEDRLSPPEGRLLEQSSMLPRSCRFLIAAIPAAVLFNLL